MKLYLFSTLIILSLTAFAKEPAALRLGRVIDSALAENAEYNLVKQNRDAAVEKIDEAIDSFVPTVRASASLSSADKTREDYKQLPLNSVPSAKVRLSQVLFSDSKLAAMSTNENRAKAQRLVAEVLRTETVGDAAQKYCAVIRYSEQINNTKSANRTFAQTEAVFKIRTPFRLSYSDFSKNLKEALSDLALITKIKNLETFSYLPYGKLFATELDSDLVSIFTAENVNSDFLSEKFTEKIIESSPELLALDTFIKINKRDIVSAQRKFAVPDVTVTGEYTRFFEGQHTDPEFFKTLDESQWNLSLRLTIPLYDGTKKQAELAEKQSELLEYFNRKTRLKEMVKERTANAVEKAVASGQVYKTAIIEMHKAEHAYKSLSGIGKYAHAKAVVTEFFHARQKLIDAEYFFISALIDVQRAYGRYFFYNADSGDRRFIDDIMAELKISR